jgi:hypothetical protein
MKNTINCRQCSALVYKTDSSHGYCFRCRIKLLDGLMKQIEDHVGTLRVQRPTEQRGTFLDLERIFMRLN